MFNHECTQRKGEVIGACMDGFLFGTCCHLPGEIETSLANVKSNQTSSQMMDELVTRGPGIIVSSKPQQVMNNQYYGGDLSLYDEEDIEMKHEVSNDAVAISSPSPSSYADRISSYHPTYPQKPTKFHYSTSQTFATELPNYIQSSPSFSDDSEEGNGNYIQFSKIPYDHSDISHASVESDVLDEENSLVSNGYPSPTTPSHLLATETRTEANVDKNKFSKPIFKPKPTQQAIISTEKYVLVHTISNDNKIQNEVIQENQQHQQPTKKPSSSTNESIQSIILMLNGTNSNNKGPEYSHIVDSTTPTSGYPSTSMIDYNKYGSSSYYITTKVPDRKTSAKVNMCRLHNNLIMFNLIG